jgi:DNA-binding MarR family transcriptional regulator
MNRKDPPKSCYDVLETLMQAHGRWFTTTDLLNRGAKTTCIHKRISELISLGWVEKKEDPRDKRRKLYRLIPDLPKVSP